MFDLMVARVQGNGTRNPGWRLTAEGAMKVWLRGMKWGATHGGYAPSQSHGTTTLGGEDSGGSSAGCGRPRTQNVSCKRVEWEISHTLLAPHRDEWR